MADPKNIFAGGSRKVQAAVEFTDPLRPSNVCDVQVDGRSLNEDLYLLSVGGSGEVNLQIDLTFNNEMFVTVFGDKITPLTFRGLAIPSTCAGTNDGSTIIQFFNKYKASASSTIAEITVSYNRGDFVFKGILVKMTLNPYTQAGPDAFTFDMTLQGRVMSKKV